MFHTILLRQYRRALEAHVGGRERCEVGRAIDRLGCLAGDGIVIEEVSQDCLVVCNRRVCRGLILVEQAL